MFFYNHSEVSLQVLSKSVFCCIVRCTGHSLKVFPEQHRIQRTVLKLELLEIQNHQFLSRHCFSYQEICYFQKLSSPQCEVKNPIIRKKGWRKVCCVISIKLPAFEDKFLIAGRILKRKNIDFTESISIYLYCHEEWLKIMKQLLK